MAVFRIEKNRNYTVMSNYHLRDMSISLKAKGLLSQMLSLPEGWDYTLSGLAHINREKIDAIREAIKELERASYIVRSRERDAQGRLRGADYVIYEHPQHFLDEERQADEQTPTSDLPTLENPILDNPTLEKPTLENPTQLNKDISSKEKTNKDVFITEISNPIPSNLQPLTFTKDSEPSASRIGTDGMGAREIYREIVLENIDYDILCQDKHTDREKLDEIAELIVDTVSSARRTIRIAGDDYPAEVVKARFLKLDSSHVQYVMDCMKDNTTYVRNIKKYLLAALYNAPSTINSYYSSLVSHDLYGSGKRGRE